MLSINAPRKKVWCAFNFDQAYMANAGDGGTKKCPFSIQIVDSLPKSIYRHVIAVAVMLCHTLFVNRVLMLYLFSNQFDPEVVHALRR